MTNAALLSFQKTENYVVVKEFTGEGEAAGFSVNVGDIVEAVDYAESSK